MVTVIIFNDWFDNSIVFVITILPTSLDMYTPGSIWIK